MILRITCLTCLQTILELDKDDISCDDIELFKQESACTQHGQTNLIVHVEQDGDGDEDDI